MLLHLPGVPLFHNIEQGFEHINLPKSLPGPLAIFAASFAFLTSTSQSQIDRDACAPAVVQPPQRTAESSPETVLPLPLLALR